MCFLKCQMIKSISLLSEYLMGSVCYILLIINDNLVVILYATLLAVQHKEQLNINRDLNQLIQLLWQARSRWRYIGIALGIDIGTLDAIQESNRYICDHSFVDMLTDWLRRPNTERPPPSWSELIDAMNAPLVRVKLIESTGIYK